MKTMITILLATTIFTLNCCKTEYNIHINDDLIRRIAQEDQKIPSQFGNVLFFAKCNDNKIAQLDVHYFRELYRLSGINTDYESFIRKLLNQVQKINCEDVANKFVLDTNIYTQYKKLRLENFIDSYCTKLEENRYALNKNMTKDQISTVQFLLFINNYIGGLDDYIGEYHVRKYEIK